jgi:hypothetical protein
VRVAVEQVVQTATRVLEGRLAPREGSTILATLTREAVTAARELRETEPDRADAYWELISVIDNELRRQAGTDAGHGHLHAVLDDLGLVLQALAETR